jgi:hypothetical protein
MLNLNELEKGLPAITPAFGKALAEAGGVCLESQGHTQGQQIKIKGDFSNEYSLIWPAVTSQALRCWNDPEVTTEHGAVAIAVLLAKKEIGFSVIERSRKGTGFDYWLGEESDFPFENKAWLEISGIRKGNEHSIRARIQKKKRQTDQSDGVLLGFIIVVEFSQPVAELRKK